MIVIVRKVGSHIITINSTCPAIGMTKIILPVQWDKNKQANMQFFVAIFAEHIYEEGKVSVPLDAHCARHRTYCTYAKCIVIVNDSFSMSLKKVTHFTPLITIFRVIMHTNFSSYLTYILAYNGATPWASPRFVLVWEDESSALWPTYPQNTLNISKKTPDLGHFNLESEGTSPSYLFTEGSHPPVPPLSTPIGCSCALKEI